MIRTLRTHYDANSSELGLEGELNRIGYEKILNILPCYLGSGEYFYTIIYKENEEE